MSHKEEGLFEISRVRERISLLNILDEEDSTLRKYTSCSKMFAY